MGDDHDGHPQVVELLEEAQDGLAGGLVEVAGGFVGEHDGRAADQGSGDGDALALAARELGGAGVGSLVEADQCEGVEGPGAPFGLGDPGVEEAVGHVVEGALVFGQEELLEHEADPGGPQRGQLAVGEPLDVEAGDAHPAGGGPVQGAHEMQQGGLARPRRADDAHQLAPADGEGDLAQGGHGRLARDRSWSPGRPRGPARPRRRRREDGGHRKPGRPIWWCRRS